MATTKLLYAIPKINHEICTHNLRDTHKNHSTDVDKDMPISRTYKGYASAEYWEGSLMLCSAVLMFWYSL